MPPRQVKGALASPTSDPNTVSVTFDTTPLVGSVIVVTCGGYTYSNGATVAWSFSDNKGNTYAVDDDLYDNVATGHSLAIGSAPVLSSSTTFTVTASVTNPNLWQCSIWICAEEWVGVAPANALDQHVITDNGLVTSTTPDTTAAGTLAQADELVVAALDIIDSGNTTFTPQATGSVPSSGWSHDLSHDGSVGPAHSVVSVLAAATTGPRHVWTISPTRRYMAVLATYKLVSALPLRRGVLIPGMQQTRGGF